MSIVFIAKISDVTNAELTFLFGDISSTAVENGHPNI